MNPHFVQRGRVSLSLYKEREGSPLSLNRGGVFARRLSIVALARHLSRRSTPSGATRHLAHIHSEGIFQDTRINTNPKLEIPICRNMSPNAHANAQEHTTFKTALLLTKTYLPSV